jgi:hypothetical protein
METYTPKGRVLLLSLAASAAPSPPVVLLLLLLLLLLWLSPPEAPAMLEHNILLWSFSAVPLNL